MVTPMLSIQDQFLTALRQWYDALPAGVVTVDERQEPDCLKIRFVPRRNDAAKLTLEVMPYGRFDLYCGHGFMLEGLPLNADVCLEYLNAVSSGRLHERLWEKHGRVRKSVSTLTTVRQTYTVSQTTSLLAWLVSPIDRYYAAWS